MLSAIDLETELRRHLPSELHAAAPALAEVLTEASTGVITPETAQARLAASPRLANALSALQGRQVEVASADASRSVISFGSGSQMGDVTINGNVAGRDIYYINVNAKGEATQDLLLRQINELYSPLWGALEESQRHYDILCQLIPRKDGRIDMSQFSKKDSEVWNHFTETYFLPLNAKMKEIICSNLHLVEGGALPESFNQFLDHAARFESLHQLWKEKGVDTSRLPSPPSAQWPADFDTDVEETLIKLQAQYRQSTRV